MIHLATLGEIIFIMRPKSFVYIAFDLTRSIPGTDEVPA
jgi:hypothetical protein